MYSTVLSFPGRYKKRHTFSLASTHRECFKIYLVVEQYVCNEMAIFYICSLHSIAWKCSRLLSLPYVPLQNFLTQCHTHIRRASAFRAFPVRQASTVSRRVTVGNLSLSPELDMPAEHWNATRQLDCERFIPRFLGLDYA